MIQNQEIRRLMDRFGFDELTAWRHLRDRRIAQDKLAYQNRAKLGRKGV